MSSSTTTSSTVLRTLSMLREHRWMRHQTSMMAPRLRRRLWQPSRPPVATAASQQWMRPKRRNGSANNTNTSKRGRSSSIGMKRVLPTCSSLPKNHHHHRSTAVVAAPPYSYRPGLAQQQSFFASSSAKDKAQKETRSSNTSIDDHDKDETKPSHNGDDDDNKDAAATATSTTTTQKTTTTDAATVGQHYWEQIQTVPNLLTLSRIGAAPCISYWIVTDQTSLAGVACLAAGVTDVLDGWIAKQWPSQKSALGTYLDPMADKVLINTVSLSLGWSGILPTPLVTLWMTKDVALMVATYVHVRRERRAQSVWQVIDPIRVPLQIQPTVTSKVNTGLQFATLAVALYAGHCPALTTLSWITGTTTILSVASYWDYGAFRPTTSSSSGGASTKKS